MSKFTKVILALFLITDVYALVSSHNNMGDMQFASSLVFVIIGTAALSLSLFNDISK